MQSKKKSQILATILLTEALIGSSIFYARKSNSDSNHADNSSLASYYVDTDNIIIPYDFDAMEITSNEANSLAKDAKIYIVNHEKIVSEETNPESVLVTVCKYNNDYALVTLADGRIAYVKTSDLHKWVNLHETEYEVITDNKETTFKANTEMYNHNGLFKGYTGDLTKGKIVASNANYSLVVFSDNTEAFISNDALNITKTINGCAYIHNNTTLYLDESLTIPANGITINGMVNIYIMTSDYAMISDLYSSDLYYVKPENLDKNFVLINLISQKMECYLDYQVVAVYNTRTGKNSTPTHTGDFDIDDKIANFEFTTFPGSRAKYWMPINEYEEGIHDLVGDDEWNYGNASYELNGSHGCIRVPKEGSEFVYNNYSVGDMVLVRKR